MNRMEFSSKKKRPHQNSKDCQIEPVEIDNLLNFELYVMFRQAANDMFTKRPINNSLQKQL